MPAVNVERRETVRRAHIVQIVDEPNQILPLQTWNSIFVCVPAEEVGELAVEIG